MRPLRELAGVDLIWSLPTPKAARCDLWAGDEVVLTVTWTWDSPACFILRGDVHAAEEHMSVQMTWNWGRQVVAWEPGASHSIASFESEFGPPTYDGNWFRTGGLLRLGSRFLRWEQIVPSTGTSWAMKFMARKAESQGLFSCSFFDVGGQPLLTFEPLSSRGTPGLQGQVHLSPSAASLPDLAAVVAIGGLLRLEQGHLSHTLPSQSSGLLAPVVDKLLPR